MPKQILMDFLVVLVAPVCFVSAYYFLGLGNEITTDELLAVTATSGETAEPGAPSVELGAKGKEILTELKSINFDQSFFSDPIFLSLQDFTPRLDSGYQQLGWAWKMGSRDRYLSLHILV